MRLHQLHSRSPHNATWTNDEGQVLYKASTPNAMVNSVTTISRVIPNSGPPLKVPGVNELPRGTSSTSETRERSSDEYSGRAHSGDEGEKDGKYLKYEADSDGEGVGQDEQIDLHMQDRFEVMGKIEWSFLQVAACVFDWGDKRIKTSEFFTKSKLGPAGRDRHWVASDGRKYKWEMGWTTTKLVLDDGSKPAKVIAKFHRDLTGPQWLDIDPEGERIVDEIIFGYIFVERLRKNRERAGRY